MVGFEEFITTVTSECGRTFIMPAGEECPCGNFTDWEYCKEDNTHPIFCQVCGILPNHVELLKEK